MALLPWKNKRTEVGSPETTVPPLSALRGEMDRLMDSFLRDPFGNLDWPLGARRGFVPVDISEEGDALVVRAEMPGMDPKDIDLNLSGNQLVMSGEKRQTSEEKDRNTYRSECAYGSFRRVVELPAEVDPERVTADYASGVLTVRLTKSATRSGKKVEIKAH